MKKTDKLKRAQVFAIPKLLEKQSVGEIADDFGVSWQAIWYWIIRLRSSGVVVKTRKKGQTGMVL